LAWWECVLIEENCGFVPQILDNQLCSWAKNIGPAAHLYFPLTSLLCLFGQTREKLLLLAMYKTAGTTVMGFDLSG
jgi:hypothetical protein